MIMILKYEYQNIYISYVYLSFIINSIILRYKNKIVLLLYSSIIFHLNTYFVIS